MKWADEKNPALKKKTPSETSQKRRINKLPPQCRNATAEGHPDPAAQMQSLWLLSCWQRACQANLRFCSWGWNFEAGEHFLVPFCLISLRAHQLLHCVPRLPSCVLNMHALRAGPGHAHHRCSPQHLAQGEACAGHSGTLEILLNHFQGNRFPSSPTLRVCWPVSRVQRCHCGPRLLPRPLGSSGHTLQSTSSQGPCRN